MASSSAPSSSSRRMHVTIVYTLSPDVAVKFARSRREVLVKAHPQLKGSKDRFGSCQLGDIVKAVCTSSPNLLPNSRTDYSVFLQDPKETYRQAKYADPSQTPAPPVEVQEGLIGWALDDASAFSQAKVIGILRKDEVEEGEEGSDDEVEESLEVRLRLVKTEPMSHATHLSQLSAFQQGLPYSSPPRRTPGGSSSLHTSPLAAPALRLPYSTSTLRDHPTPPTSAPASASTPTNELLPPPPPLSQPVASSSSSSSSRHPESELAERPRAKKARAAPASPMPTLKAPAEPAKKESRRKSTTSKAASAASTPAAAPPSSTTKPRRASNATVRSTTPASTPAASSSTPSSSSHFTAELLSHLTKSTYAEASSSTLPTISEGSSSSSTFSPALLELLTKLGKDQSLTGDKETVGILTSLLQAAEKEKEDNERRKEEPETPASEEADEASEGPSRGGRGSKARGKQGFRGTKRKSEGLPELVDDGTGCSTCGRMKSNTWRAREGGLKVCNACGLHWNKYKVHRPKELWGDPDASPARRRKPTKKVVLEGVRTRGSEPDGESYLMTSPVREGDDHNYNSTQHHLAMTSPMRGKNGWDFQGLKSSQAGERLKALTSGGKGGGAATSPAAPLRRSLAGRKAAFSTSKTDESPRKALKRMLSVSGEVELRRLKGPLSDDDTHSSSNQTLTRGPRSPAKTLRSRNASNGSSRGAQVGLVHAPGIENAMKGGKELHDGQTEVDEAWMGSDFSTLFDLDAASSAGGTGGSMSDGGYGTDMQIDELDGSMHGDLMSDQPSFKLQLSSDHQNELNSQTMFTSSPNSSHHSLSHPSPLPFDFSSLPPSSPPVIPPGLFSSPPGDDEMELESPIFSILGATPTAEELRQTPTVASNAYASSSKHKHQHQQRPDEHDINQYLTSPASSSPKKHDDHHSHHGLPPQDLEAFQSFFANAPSPSVLQTSSTNLPSSAYDPALLDSSNPTPPSTSGTQVPSAEEQAAFYKLWRECEVVANKGKEEQGDAGSEHGGGTGVTPPSWVT